MIGPAKRPKDVAVVNAEGFGQLWFLGKREPR
jgi:hypothetical protein